MFKRLEIFKDLLPSFVAQKLGYGMIGEPELPEYIEIDHNKMTEGGVSNFFINFDLEFNNISQLVYQYEQFALLDFVEDAIDEIVDESIILDDFNPVVELNLDQVNLFLREVVLGYLPRVFIAALLLVIATLVSDAIRRLVEGSAKAMGVHSARMAGSIAKWAIWIFVTIIVLSELGIAPAFMQILFTGIVAMLALAGGLAFGLGGKDAASRVVQKMRDSVASHHD